MLIAEAELSDEKPRPLYRYTLTRIWDTGRRILVWVLLNPSTADATINDPTLVKCRMLADQWGYGGVILLNLFAYRATKPEGLLRVEPVGEFNDEWIRRTLANPRVGDVIVGWGNGNAAAKLVAGRASQVLEIIRQTLHADRLACVGINQNGTPKHPLYLPYSVERIPYQPTHWALVGTGENTMSLQIELLHSPSAVALNGSPNRGLTPPDEPQWGPRATDHPRA
jgi:hypothetical protein